MIENIHPSIEMFEINDQAVLFKSLLHNIRTGDASQFHNCDAGHPVYIAAWNESCENTYPFAGYDIHNDSNFRLLKILSTNLKNYGFSDTSWFRTIETWQDYQDLIRERSNKTRRKQNTY